MLYVALVPASVWVVVLIALALALVVYGRRAAQGQTAPASLMLLLILSQALFAAVAAIATSVDSISHFACRSGLLGIMLTPGLGLIHLGVFTYLSIARRRSGLSPAWPWLLSLLVFQLLVWLTHARSAVLCTV